MKKNYYLHSSSYFSPGVKKLLLTMRISIFLSLCCILNMSASLNSNSQTFNLKLTDVKVKEVFKVIEEQSNYRFFYNDELSDVNRLVTVNTQNSTVNDVLAQLFGQSLVTYKVLDNNLIVIAPKQTLQQIKVTGVITDGTNNEPLPGVNIVIEGTTIGVTSDIDGKYAIDLPGAEATLVFSFLGYNVERIKYAGSQSINVSLIPDVKKLDEVVVIGYGTVRKSDLTGAVASVSESQLRSSIVTNIDQAMQGRVAGVMVTQNSGQPGGGTSIRIRGANSVTGSSEPLYVIDGIPFQGDGNTISGFSWSSGSNGQTKTNPLATLNPNDIVKMEVLKDASATAIYGARAANGVVLITTRRGEKGQTKVSYNGYYAIQQIPKRLEMMNLREFADYRNETDKEVDRTPNERFLDPSLLGEGTDWQDEIFRSAGMQSHQIAVSGGSEKSTFAITGSYFKQDGIILNSGFDRYTSRVNLDQKVYDWLKVGESLAFSKVAETIATNDGTTGIIQNALKLGPNIPVRDINGEYAGPENTTGGITLNPVAAAKMRTNKVWRQRLMGSLYADITFLKNFVFRSELGFDNNHSLNKAFEPTYKWGMLQNDINRLRQAENNSFFWIIKNYLNYNVTLGSHTIGAMIGQEAQKNEYEGSVVTKSKFATNDMPVLSGGTDKDDQVNTTTGGNKGASSIVSYFGRANYSFKDKYLFTFTMRADGSSKFGANNRWGYFPSGSIAWKVTKEEFMPKSDVLSELKLRFGYGEVGNQAINDFLYGSNLASFPSPLGTAYKNAKIPNPNLKWESTRQYNIGMDMSLFSNRITLDINFYKKFTKDMLLQLSVPSYLGGTGGFDIAAPYGNIGRMENKGFEITLLTRNTTGKFLWTTDFTFSLNRNLVKELESENATMWGSVEWHDDFKNVIMTKAGYPLGVFYGYETEGLFQNKQDILDHAVQLQENGSVSTENPNGINFVNRADGLWIGDIKFKDINNDGVIDTKDQTVIGDPNPDFTCGLTNNFSYGSFDLTLQLAASVGGDILNVQKFELSGMSSMYNNQLKIVDGRAREQLIDPAGSNTDPDNVVIANPGATVPRYALGNNNKNSRMSDRWIEDGSYLRIQTLSLGYTLPSTFTKKVKIERLKVYMNISNLYTFTNYSGYDPEIGAFDQNSRMQNVDMGRYPTPRIVTFGVDVDF